MKKFIGVLVLFSSLSALANDFYIDCRLPGSFTEGYTVTNKISLDAKASNWKNQLCLKVNGALTSKSCTFSHCDTNSIKLETADECFADAEAAKAALVKRYCDHAESASIEDGERPAKKAETRVKPIEC